MKTTAPGAEVLLPCQGNDSNTELSFALESRNESGIPSPSKSPVRDSEGKQRSVRSSS